MKDRMDKKDKTNAVRMLDAKKARYALLSIPLKETGSGPIAVSAREVAVLLGKSPEETFKTLVTAGRSREHYVFVVPGSCELNLRKAAQAVDEKSVEMIPARELLPLTGYVHGGCSPVGMKKAFRTVVDVSAENYDTIVISAGRVGLHIAISLSELRKAISFTLADVAAAQQ